MSGLYEAGRRFLRANWELVEGGWKSDESKGIATPPQEEAIPAGATLVSLPAIGAIAPRGGSIVELLQARRSRRKFGPGALGLEELALLCWASAGVRRYGKNSSFRSYPSGGSRHPLDLFVFVARVEGVEPGLYRYLPVEHALCLLRAGGETEALDEALMGQYWKAAAVFVWAAVPYRTEWRYGPVSHKVIALDAGHACENLYLACEAIGCGTCAIGAYDQAKLDAYLGLDGEERFTLYAAPVGRAAGGN